LYDTSENEYRKYDTWDVTDNGDNTYTINSFDAYPADAQNDKLCSIAGVKPASGECSTDFTRQNCNQMGKNRGTGWGEINIKILSAEQLLFVIEYGQFNSQAAIQDGVTYFGSHTHNEGVFTGSTSFLGNSTGAAESSTRLSNTDIAYISDDRAGYKSIRYRGCENPFGHMFKYIIGVNILGNGKKHGGEVYICDDFNYAERKSSDNYKSTEIVVAAANGGNRYFGYNKQYDYLFIPSLANNGATSALPTGDTSYVSSKNNDYKGVGHGGEYTYTLRAGYFCYGLNYPSSYRSRVIGSRLIKV
jgi:hypothetical protein